MNKPTRNKTKWIVAIVLFVFLCSIWAIAPLWADPCIPIHLSEEEIKQFREEYGSKSIPLEEQKKNDQRNREQEIPCGAQDLPLLDKLEAARFQGIVLDELEMLNPIILRVEFTGIIENTDLYHYKGYTFFFIPVFDAVGGGSGSFEIRLWPRIWVP
jgi:hypothetical protein